MERKEMEGGELRAGLDSPEHTATRNRDDESAGWREGSYGSRSGEPAARETGSLQQTERIYRGVRYGEPEIVDQPQAEPYADDAPINLFEIAGIPESYPPVHPTQEEETSQPVGDRQWWEAPSDTAEETAGAGDDTEAAVLGTPAADSGPGFYYRGVRYGEPEPALEGPDDEDDDLLMNLTEVPDEPWEAPLSAAAPTALSQDQPAGHPIEGQATPEPVFVPPWWEDASAPGRTVEPEGRADEEDHSAAELPAEDLATGREPQIEASTPPVGAPATAAFPEGRPADTIRQLAAEICPDELLLVENAGTPLPDWAGAAVSAAWEDLKQRTTAREPINAAEYLRLAIVENVLGLHEEAEAHLKEALQRSDRLGTVLNALAVTSLACGKLAPAVVYGKEALQETGGDNSVRAAASSNLGEFYRLDGNEAQAVETYASAIDSMGPQGNPRWLSRLHLRAGRLHRSMNQGEMAQTHLSEAVRLFKDAGDDPGRVEALAELGSTQTESGAHDVAIRSLEEGIRICLRTGDRPGAAGVQYAIGVAYMAQDQLTRALAYLESALTLFRELQDPTREVGALVQIGKIHDSRGDTDEAQRIYAAAEQLGRS